ncbi:hypothetical protein V8B55DRAFT_1481868 [Mucor lusitanicus]|uniref:Uncharacterized protein n=2 Tax=Mucor circinelloides f. lusitanicus TaxID=29924 RepID=A0A168I3Z8_MUCCL|nr:hypothetical protein FB192DRAFT_1379187 [Mucor lusitanicus]OAC99520.1 hypothetical protein MUCCIDRAFT_84447 [Mucor lusitanicus CBS 277.49]
MSDTPKILKKNDDKIKQMSVIGLSVYAVVHSHLYWVYSILYIAYHQITPHKKPLNNCRWKFPDHTQKKSKRKHPHQKHSKKKSLTHKPKAIIPSTKPKTAVIALATKTTPIDDAKHALVQQKVPLLHAFRTFPSSSGKNPLNIHQLIKSHRKIPKRSNSTGHLINEVSLPPSLVNSEEDTSSDDSSIHIQTLSPIKRNRALGLLRSTFHRSNSTGQLKQGLNSSFSSLSEDEGVVVIEAKKRKRDTLFGITRKFSSRKNVPTLATTTTAAAAGQHPEEVSPSSETKNSSSTTTTTRSKLFRNMPSWKKQSQAVVVQRP